ncbi:MAG TPA: hypothetical protein VMW35_22550 [Myxococcota bacterium]|nr:hypothetical protein [Myxococcota bacterium]
MLRALRPWIPVAAAAAFAVAVVLFVHRDSPRTLVSAHGLLHAAIAERFDEPAATHPPENPLYAARPLPYYWVYHWLGARTGALLSLDPLHAFELLDLAGIVALCAGAGALAASLLGDAAAGAWIAWLVFAGANPEAPLVLLARVARRGLPTDDGTYLWGLVHPASAWMRIGDPYGMYGPLANFFLNVTARPLTIAALVVLLAALHRAWRRPGALGLVVLAASAALLAALGPLVGLAAGGSLCAALVGVGTLRGRSDARRALLAAAALAAGMLAASPSFAHLFGVAGGRSAVLEGGLGGMAGRVVTLAASAWLLAALAGWQTVAARGEARTFFQVLLAAAAILAVAALVASLPQGNEDNLFHAALVLLAAPAAACVLDPRQTPPRVGRGRAAALFAVFAPVLALVLACYLGRPAVPLAFDGRELVRLPAHSDLSRLYAWIRAETPHDAVLVIDPGPPVRAFAGNTAELPAFTRRVLYTERERHYLVEPYADAAQRYRVAMALASGEALAPEDRAALAALERPIFLVVPDLADRERLARIASRLGPPVFRAGDATVFAVAAQ